MTANHNLLVNLFPWRLRDSIAPKENFLTEAFVHVLRRNKALRECWLTDLLGKAVDVDSIQFSTRASYLNSETSSTIYPDVEMIGEFVGGEPFRVILEVKWDSPYDRNQIEKYDKLFDVDDRNFLIFLCAKREDYKSARTFSPERSTYKAVLWEHIFPKIETFSGGCILTQELAGFMEHHGLTPGQPISNAMLDGFLLGRKLIERFERYCEKLRIEFDWGNLPSIYTDATEVTNKYGRVAIMMGPTWQGAISLGFLYDNRDHRVPFEDGSTSGVDLMMRIESSPHAKGRDSVMGILKERAPFARAEGGVVRLADDRANRNANTLLLAQRKLSDFLAEPSEGDQLVLMHRQLSGWISALFGDGKLGESLTRMQQVNKNL